MKFNVWFYFLIYIKMLPILDCNVSDKVLLEFSIQCLETRILFLNKDS